MLCYAMLCTRVSLQFLLWNSSRPEQWRFSTFTLTHILQLVDMQHFGSEIVTKKHISSDDDCAISYHIIAYPEKVLIGHITIKDKRQNLDATATFHAGKCIQKLINFLKNAFCDRIQSRNTYPSASEDFKCNSVHIRRENNIGDHAPFVTIEKNSNLGEI